jgi:DNA phosphorothioation-associated putative methyltransferase
MNIARYKTAISRKEISRPVRLALEDGFIAQGSSVLDYGCGKGDDVRHLKERGITCNGWDPVHFAGGIREPSDVVNLGYIVNVIENPEERVDVLRSAWTLTKKILIVSARLKAEVREIEAESFEDGLLTRRATFQKFFEHHELREWIDTSLSKKSVPAAPGVFYVFREQENQQAYLAAKYRRRSAAPRQRISDVLFERHKEWFEHLMNFLTDRGRLPEPYELEVAPLLIKEVGSLRKAFGIIRRVTNSVQWDRICRERAQDLLLYLALSRFGGRPKFSQLPDDLQLDVKAFYSTYNRACALADELLFSAGNMRLIDEACHQSPVGKLTQSALYVHVSALPLLSPVLRVYEGCARSYVGAVDGANIIKLLRGNKGPQVSYLAYPDFDVDPHPALYASLVVPLQTFRSKYREYKEADNPPILHRKEEFISADHPLHSKFAKLSKQEDSFKLYETPEIIGTREGWLKVLEERGVYLSGHRVLRKPRETE